MRPVLKYVQQHKTQLLPIAAVVFLVLISFVIQRATQQSQQLRSRAAADNGQLTLSTPATGTIAPGQNVDVSVNLINGGQVVVGADVLLQFDRTKLQMISITPNTTTNAALKAYTPFTSTNTFDTATVITNANTNGIVEFGVAAFDPATSQVTNPTVANTTVSPLATIRFQVRTGASGQSVLSFKNDGITATQDSNVVVISGNVSEDILQPTPYTNSSLTINLGTVSATPQPSSSPLATPPATPRPSATLQPSTSPGQCTVHNCFDFNNNGVISISEIQNVASRFNVQSGNANYLASCDMNCNGAITAFDIQSQASYFNRSCQ